MNIKEIGNVFHCDCGFSWHRGKNGNHNCADGLREKVRQLAAENMALKAVFSQKEIPSEAVDAFMETAVMDHDWNETSEWSWVENETEVIHAVLDALKPETPATDRIVAEAEARGVEKGIAHLEKKFSNIGVQIMNLQWLADSLREGADK